MISPNATVLSAWLVEEVNQEASPDLQMRLAKANHCLLCLSDTAGLGW